jgi:hypothetical protein
VEEQRGDMGQWMQDMQLRARSFIQRVFKPPRKRDAAPSQRRRTMPCELFLNIGWQSIKLFPSGPIDEFRFFQRGGVSLSHDVEFLARLDLEDAGTEEFKPYGLFRLERRYSEALANLEQREDLWATLLEDYGLQALPGVRALASHRFQSFDPRFDSADEGANRIDPPEGAKAYVRASHRHFSYADVLGILRVEMSTQEKIAWLEAAFDEKLAAGEVYHRYYLDRSKQAWLVRHHWTTGKRLYRAQTNEEALAFCLASGHFDREQVQRKAA